MISKIGNVKINNNLILAPMAGITDIAFRTICKNFGAGLICTEMVNVNAIVRNNKATLLKMKFSKMQKPVSIQLFGAKTDLIIQSAKKVEDIGADIVDFNLGCPDQKIIRQGAGSALLKRPAKVQEIIKAIVDNVNIPVTAKIRIGKDNGIKIAKIVEKAGASAVAVHGRTVAQRYSGKANWDAIKQIKKEVGIPVIGNGDVFRGEDAKLMIEKTNCDFVMIGRGAMKNPGIFREVNNCLEGKNGSEITVEEKLNLIFEYLELSKNHKGIRFPDFKRHALNFTNGINGAVELRRKIGLAKSSEEILEIVKKFKK